MFLVFDLEKYLFLTSERCQNNTEYLKSYEIHKYFAQVQSISVSLFSFYLELTFCLSEKSNTFVLSLCRSDLPSAAVQQAESSPAFFEMGVQTGL